KRKKYLGNKTIFLLFSPQLRLKGGRSAANRKRLGPQGPELGSKSPRNHAKLEKFDAMRRNLVSNAEEVTLRCAQIAAGLRACFAATPSLESKRGLARWGSGSTRSTLSTIGRKPGQLNPTSFRSTSAKHTSCFGPGWVGWLSSFLSCCYSLATA